MDRANEQDSDEREQEAIDRAIYKQILKMVVEYSGPVVRELDQSKIAAYQSLNHPNPKIRFAALLLVGEKWGVTQEIADMCEEVAENDPDAKVRGAAIICLNDYYRRTSHPRIVKLLATIAVNESEALDVREVAYSGLFSLLEPDPLKWPRLGLGFKFPNDVDWAFLNACLQSQDR